MLKPGLRVLLLIGASWLFASIAADVSRGDPPSALDASITHWFHVRATPWATRGMLLFTNLHSTAGISLFAVLLALYLLWKKEGHWILTLFLVLPVGMLINVLLKHIFLRDRPSFSDPILTLASYSFPSGHVAGATLFYGVIAAFLCSRLHAWQWRVAIVLTACVMVVLVGITRLYLGVHYFSDVVAAAVWSSAWLALCLTGMAALKLRRRVRGA